MKKRYYLIPFMLLLAGITLCLLERDTVKEVQIEEEEHDEHKDDTSEPHAEHDHDEHAEHDEHDEHGEESEGGHEESTGGVGPNNAVIAADEDTGIKLAEKAVKTIGLTTQIWDGSEIPSSALVFHEDRVSVYWVNEGWYKLIQAQKLEAGDTFVVTGTALLRVAELDAFSGEVDHSH